MPAVSDSSPLILFSRMQRLDLLEEMYSLVLIPPAVWREVVEDGARRPGTSEVARAAWLHQVGLEPSSTVARLTAQLGPGEAEAIALASGLGDPIPLLLDDLKGRRVARELGLHVVGSAGVLITAKGLGLIVAVRPLLEDLRKLGLHLSERAFVEVLRHADEEAID